MNKECKCINCGACEHCKPWGDIIPTEWYGFCDKKNCNVNEEDLCENVEGPFSKE